RPTQQSKTHSRCEDQVMAFTEAQVKSLEAKLDSKHVKTRQVQDTVLNYVEGWHVIAEANRIFGYDAWDRQTITAHSSGRGWLTGTMQWLTQQRSGFV